MKVCVPAPVRARRSEGKTMAENTNFYTAEESLFGLPTIMTNNSPCGLRDFVQNESGWCELRRIEGKVTPVPLTDSEWEMFHRSEERPVGKDLPKPDPSERGRFGIPDHLI